MFETWCLLLVEMHSFTKFIKVPPAYACSIICFENRPNFPDSSVTPGWDPTPCLHDFTQLQDWSVFVDFTPWAFADPCVFSSILSMEALQMQQLHGMRLLLVAELVNPESRFQKRRAPLQDWIETAWEPAYATFWKEKVSDLFPRVHSSKLLTTNNSGHLNYPEIPEHQSITFQLQDGGH